MIKKITLTNVQRYTKDKNGNPFKTKDGKPYERLLIKCEEYGDKLLSGFGGQWNDGWKAGDEQTIDITEVQKEGNTYLNFGKVNMQDRMMEMIQELNKRVLRLEEIQRGGFDYPVNVEEPNFDPKDEPPVESLEDLV